MAEPTAELAIDATGVARRFGTRWVLRGVTMRVQAGEAVGLLGANGSGKSTLLRIFGTLLRPSAGTASVYGHDVVRGADRVRGTLGFLAHTPGLYDDLTARENLRFAAAMLGGRDFGAGADVSAGDIADVLARVGLAHAADERVRGFSAGMERRLAVARMLLARPRLLLLDEPYSNLDADGIALMSDIISQAVHAGGAAVVVLHELAPAAGVLDRTVTLRDGRA
ncbi:MAG: heme ABC exporter ATP-binding protein CcmA [Gemmatimonadaceae bacterium]